MPLGAASLVHLRLQPFRMSHLLPFHGCAAAKASVAGTRARCVLGHAGPRTTPLRVVSCRAVSSEAPESPHQGSAPQVETARRCTLYPCLSCDGLHVSHATAPQEAGACTVEMPLSQRRRIAFTGFKIVVCRRQGHWVCTG